MRRSSPSWWGLRRGHAGGGALLLLLAFSSSGTLTAAFTMLPSTPFHSSLIGQRSNKHTITSMVPPQYPGGGGGGGFIDPNYGVGMHELICLYPKLLLVGRENEMLFWCMDCTLMHTLPSFLFTTSRRAKKMTWTFTSSPSKLLMEVPRRRHKTRQDGLSNGARRRLED